MRFNKSIKLEKKRDLPKGLTKVQIAAIKEKDLWYTVQLLKACVVPPSKRARWGNNKLNYDETYELIFKSPPRGLGNSKDCRFKMRVEAPRVGCATCCEWCYFKPVTALVKRGKCWCMNVEKVG